VSDAVTIRTGVTEVRTGQGETVTVRQNAATIVAAGASGPAGPTWAGHFGSFYNTTDETLGAINTAQPVAFNGTYTSSGVSIVSGSRITLAHVGTYALTFVAQLSNLANDVEEAVFWLKLNGSDYPNSATRAASHARKSAGVPFSQLVTVTFVGTSQAPGDYVQIFWLGTSTQLSLQADAVSVSPAFPAAPSVVLSVGQIA
jgi:hypothetical protein